MLISSTQMKYQSIRYVSKLVHINLSTNITHRIKMYIYIEYIYSLFFLFFNGKKERKMMKR